MARILIIDDEASIRRPLQIILERAGHEVVSAANGSEAVRLWISKPFTLDEMLQAVEEVLGSTENPA